MPDDLARVYDQHADALFGFLLNVTRDEGETREALQEVFLKIARRPAILQGARDERAFLLRLSHNTARDLFRRKNTRAEHETRWMGDTVSIFAPIDDRDAQVLRDTIAEALGELPEEQRSVVHLKLWEGMTFDAISEVLGIPLNTAASRYRYALDKLRTRLRPLHQELE
jgi:RNA polymerase sigma-70 factor (ECF subfamily)